MFYNISIFADLLTNVLYSVVSAVKDVLYIFHVKPED